MLTLLYQSRFGPLVLQDDDVGLKPQYSGEQRLLIVCQAAPLLALCRKFLLQRPDPAHQVSFVEALDRIVRGTPSTATRTPSTSSVEAPVLGVSLTR